MKFKRGILYSLKNDLWGTNIYKIGNTGQIMKKRLSTIQTSLYLNCEIVYQTNELVCCKYYEKILEKILSPYRINPKREFYYITEEEIKLLFDSFSELNQLLNDEMKLLKYIQENNPEYLLDKKRNNYESSSCSRHIANKVGLSSDKPKNKKQKGLYVDTRY